MRHAVARTVSVAVFVLVFAIVLMAGLYVVNDRKKPLVRMTEHWPLLFGCAAVVEVADRDRAPCPPLTALQIGDPQNGRSRSV